MRLLSVFSLLGFALLTSPALASSHEHHAPPADPQTTVVFVVPATHVLPNPYGLPPRTHATLSSSGHHLRAPLSESNSFIFHNVTAGSYLLDVHCPTHGFIPARLDVTASEEGSGGTKAQGWNVRAWETFRGNDWDNRGEALVVVDDHVFELRAYAAKNYFMERSSFSLLSILKNPMILLGLVSMGVFFGMPYLMNSMDPEMRAEFEERQKNSAMNTILSGPQPGANSGFDIASYLSGSSSKKDEPGSGAGAGGGSGGGGSGGAGKRAGKR